MNEQNVERRKRCLIVVNPCAGRRKGLRALPKLHRLFDDAGYSVTDHVTASRGDGRAFVEHAEGFDMILCVGGDGTLNEVITGVLRSGKNVPVGYIPAGSTNDFARSLGIPYKPMKAAKQILSFTDKVFGNRDQRHKVGDIEKALCHKVPVAQQKDADNYADASGRGYL